MFHQGYWGQAYFGDEYWPPVGDIVVPPPPTDGGPRKSFGGSKKPIPRREIRRRFEEAIKKVKVASVDEIGLNEVPFERIDIERLEVEIAKAVSERPEGARKVLLNITREDILLPSAIDTVEEEDDTAIRLLLLMGDI